MISVWRIVGVVGVTASVFLSGYVMGSHRPPAAAQAQGTPTAQGQAQGQGAQGSPLQEYRLANGVICYIMVTTGGQGFSCIYAPGAPSAFAQ
jgi:hypothetical protein